MTETRTKVDTLDTFFAKVVDLSTEYIMANGKHPPAFWALLPDGGISIIMTVWRDDADKAPMLAMVRAQLRAMKAVAYAHVSETWVVTAQPGEGETVEDASKRLEAAWARGDRPSESPDRKEVLWIFATDGDRMKTRAFLMKRNWKGKLTGLEEMPRPEGGGELTGRMTKLLDGRDW